MKEYSITEISTEIYEELGSLDFPTQQQIYFWIAYNSGRVNNLISTNFQFEGSDYEPKLQTDEKDIVKSLYYEYYYRDQSRKALTNSANSILSLKDDVSAVSFTNPKEIARVYNDMSKEKAREVYTLSNLYKHNRAGPRDPRNTHDGRWE